MDPDRLSPFYYLKKKMRKQQSEDVLMNFFSLGGLSALAAVLMFALHIVMARLLGPAMYAAYGTYIAILFTALFSFSGIHLIITRFVTYYRTRHQYEHINYLVSTSLSWLFGLGFLLFIIIIVFARPITDFFHLSRIDSTIVLGFALWFTLLVPVFEGAFKGTSDYRSMGVLRFVEAAARLALAVLLVMLGFGLSGALFGVGLGTFVGLMVTYLPLYRLQRLDMRKPDLKQVKRFALPVFVTMLCIALLLNLDVILVKHYFAPTEAGFFAAASLLAKLPFFVSMVLTGVTFPKVTRLFADGKRTDKMLKRGFQLLIPLILVFTLMTFFFAGPLFSLIFGSAYTIGPVLGLYTFGMGCLAITAFLASYLLALRKDGIVAGFPVAVALLIALLMRYHDTLAQVMVVVLLVNSLLAAWLVYRARSEMVFDYFI